MEDGVPINYITYIKDNSNQDFVTIEFSENYYYIYKRKATDHSKELWLSGRMNNTRKLRMTITDITAKDKTVDVAVRIDNAPDGVKSVQARIDNYGPYTQLIKKEGGIWSGSIDTGSYTPELIAGTHFVGVEAFDNEDKKWTEYKDYSTPSDNPTIKWVFETGDSIQSKVLLITFLEACLASIAVFTPKYRIKTQGGKQTYGHFDVTSNVRPHCAAPWQLVTGN